MGGLKWMDAGDTGDYQDTVSDTENSISGRKLFLGLYKISNSKCIYQ